MIQSRAPETFIANGFCDCALRAFSLVEVVLSVGIVSFALLAMVALVPVGIQTTHDSLEETGAINLLSSLAADRRASPMTSPSVLYALPPLVSGMGASSNTFGVTAANTNSTDFAQSAYRVTYEITAPATGSLAPFRVYFKVSWPAAVASAQASGYLDECLTFPQP